MMIETVNPTTGKVIQQYKYMANTTVDNIIHTTHQAYLQWQSLNYTERAICMQKLASLLVSRKNQYAMLMATEMGKPIKQGIEEIEKCAYACTYFSEQAVKFLQPRLIETEMTKSYVCYQPLGVIFAIMPWNFPFWQVCRFAAPTLMAGNAALLKHAPISTGTALAIEQLFYEAGFVENLFRSVIVDNEQAANIIQHPKIMAITLTGSTQAGKTVGSLAAHALKKSVLELGGSDPYLIFSDADINLAAQSCVSSRMKNAGQSCIAAKRLIVVKDIKERFIKAVQYELEKYTLGDPLDIKTICGPLARADLRDKVAVQVSASVKAGARLLMGGILPEGEGFFYPPSLLVDVKKGMPAYDEEIFGPVIAIIEAEDEANAIQIANDTAYGLGAAIFSQDIERAEKIARREILSGTCTINTAVSSDPRLPFGGIKQSGYGRGISA